MELSSLYLLTADTILLLHMLFVAFVVFGLILIVGGKFCAWTWVHNPWFRLSHLLAIVVVVIQSWSKSICPPTTEMALRAKAGDSVYFGSFISHWMETLLYYEAPQWVFNVCYTAFGVAVVVSWILIRPRRFTKRRRSRN
jgi:hypothetical protein